MLLERDRELQILDDLLADLGSSGGKVVLVRGEAGIGKTALVRELVATHSDDLHAHVGGCDDLLIPQPFGPFWDMARVEDSLRGPLEDADRPRLLEAIMALLSRSLRPTVIVIEDTHWADEATLDAIKYLGRRIGSANGLLVLTYRTGELDYDHPLRGVPNRVHIKSRVPAASHCGSRRWRRKPRPRRRVRRPRRSSTQGDRHLSRI